MVPRWIGPTAPPDPIDPAAKPRDGRPLVDGELACFVERGGKTVLTFNPRWSSADDHSESVYRDSAAIALADLVRSGRVERLAIDTVDGQPVLSTDFGRLLVESGFTTTPRGIRLRYGSHGVIGRPRPVLGGQLSPGRLLRSNPLRNGRAESDLG